MIGMQGLRGKAHLSLKAGVYHLKISTSVLDEDLPMVMEFWRKVHMLPSATEQKSDSDDRELSLGFRMFLSRCLSRLTIDEDDRAQGWRNGKWCQLQVEPTDEGGACVYHQWYLPFMTSLTYHHR